MIWYECQWVEDIIEKNEFHRNFAILQGSFSNPEMAQKMLKEPDFVADDEQIDKTMKEIEKEIESERTNLHRRKRKKIIK